MSLTTKIISEEEKKLYCKNKLLPNFVLLQIDVRGKGKHQNLLLKTIRLLITTLKFFM